LPRGTIRGSHGKEKEKKHPEDRGSRRKEGRGWRKSFAVESKQGRGGEAKSDEGEESNEMIKEGLGKKKHDGRGLPEK